MDYKQKLEYQSNYWYNDGLKKDADPGSVRGNCAVKKKFAV